MRRVKLVLYAFAMFVCLSFICLFVLLKDQYEFIYRALAEYLESFDAYNNFDWANSSCWQIVKETKTKQWRSSEGTSPSSKRPGT